MKRRINKRTSIFDAGKNTIAVVVPRDCICIDSSKTAIIFFKSTTIKNMAKVLKNRKRK